MAWGNKLDSCSRCASLAAHVKELEAENEKWKSEIRRLARDFQDKWLKMERLLESARADCRILETNLASAEKVVEASKKLNGAFGWDEFHAALKEFDRSEEK